MELLSWAMVALLLGRGVHDLHAHARARHTGLSRLAELQAGAAETYFEERRELEAYPSRAVTPPLWHGLLGIGLALLTLLLKLLF